MKARFDHRLLCTALLLALGTGCASSRQPIAVPTPPPQPAPPSASPRPEGDREREAWIESMHRAAPGVSWREIERENRRRSASRLAQAAAGAAAPTGVWQQRGPTNLTGRTNVTVGAGDGDTLLVGSGGESGGLFSCMPGVIGWAQRANFLGAGVANLIVVPGSPESWVVAASAAVFVSTDQGAFWTKPNGLPPAPSCGFDIARLLHEPGASRTVYLLLTAPTIPNCPPPTYALLRSDDGGLDFVSLASGGFAAAPDIWMSRVAPGPLYFLTDTGLASSTNHGASFSHVGTLPGATGNLRRLAGSEA